MTLNSFRRLALARGLLPEAAPDDGRNADAPGLDRAAPLVAFASAAKAEAAPFTRDDPGPS